MQTIQFVTNEATNGTTLMILPLLISLACIPHQVSGMIYTCDNNGPRVTENYTGHHYTYTVNARVWIQGQIIPSSLGDDERLGS